ncbi:MAG TPA: hypothetical protein ENI23_07720 [bacterium]|nr:hypothetical protein [bacterium]
MQLSDFLSEVERGKEAIILGKDYIVMSRNLYDKQKQEALKPIREVWEKEMKNVAGQYSMARLVNEEWVMNYIVALENAIKAALGEK